MIAVYVDSGSEVVGDQEPSLAPRADGDGWSAGDLLDAVDRLCLAYSLPLLPRDQGPVMAEARAVEAMGIASTAYLTAAVACAIRVTSSGPAVAFGRWGGSVILTHLLATIPAVPDVPELFLDLAPGPTDLAPDWGRQPPLFLVAEDPAANVLRVLGDDPLLSEARITGSPESFALHATVGAPPRPTSLSPEGAPTGARDRTVELRPSRLLWLLREALSLVEQETGNMTRLGEEHVAWPLSGSTPHPGLLAGLPEIPAWAGTATAYGPTAADTASLWLALAPSPPTLSAAAALRTRASLAHAVLALAACWPELDWNALLTTVPKPEGGTDPSALPADRAAGVEPAGGEILARGLPETLTLKQVGLAAVGESGAVVGDRPWQHNDELLTILALGIGESRAHAVVSASPVSRPKSEEPPVLEVTRTTESRMQVWVEAALVAPVRAVVEVVVPLLGDKDRDLDRLGRVRDILGDYKGAAGVRLILTRGNFRRVLEGWNGQGVAWSGALVDAMESLLGNGCARLIE